MSLKNLKLGTKQILGFGFILVILAGVNIFSIRKMAGLKSELDEVTTNWMPRAIAISDINLNSSELRRIQLQHAFATDEARKQEQADIMITLIDKINENLDTYETLKNVSEERGLYSEQEQKLYSEFDEKWEEYQDLSFTFFKLSRDNQNREAIELLNGEAREVFNDFSSSLADLVTTNKRDSYDAAERAEFTFHSTRIITLVLLIVTVILSIVIAGVLVRYITGPVQQLERAARKVAGGDLDVQLNIQGKDEIGNLALSFDQMTISLRDAKERTRRQAEKLQKQNSDLERAMNQLRESQEQLLMKEKMAALGDLVAGVAHEINNPVGAMNSSTDVSVRCVKRIESILDRGEVTVTEKDDQILRDSFRILKDNIDVTIKGGERIATIVKSLRNFARLDEANYQKVNIHEGIDSSLTLLDKELRGRITVLKEYDNVPEIGCYPGQLNQVFLGLLKNASQAIEKSGVITIRTRSNRDTIRVEISDNGKGIPPERMGRIFDFSFSAGDSRVKMTSGLSTAYSIIQKHHGEIDVDSEVDVGTTFTITLPVT